jgi:hypothetical protein
MWLFVFLAIVAAVGAFLWWVVGQPKTEPQAPLLPGVFGPNEDVLEVDRELRRSREVDPVETSAAHDDDDHGVVL